MIDTPNYEALVKLLPTLRNLVDACGEVTLTAEEAAKIRSLGFPAGAGRWKVPSVPFELVRDNPLLENLAIGWDTRQTSCHPISIDEASKESKCSFTHGPPRNPEGRSELTYGEMRQRSPGDSELTELHGKIIRAVEEAGGCVPKRRLQQRLWRYSAKNLNEAVTVLINRRFISVENRSLVALHRSVTRDVR